MERSGPLRSRRRKAHAPRGIASTGRQAASGTRGRGGPRTAFTLLEVILALALSLLVLMALSMAIDTHLRVVDKGRRHVEQAQLARALLHRIADDIRSAVRYDPQHITIILPALKVASLEDMAAEAGFGEMDFGEVEDEEATVAETTEPPPIPGIYGNAWELQVDVSRLPRIDQFQSSLVASGEMGEVADRTSAVKTVAYYVVQENSVAAALGGPVRKGLVRRELDRAVTSFAAEIGTLWDMEADLEPIAPEVLALEFEYFDGYEWVAEWDSDELGGLPMAIRIAITLQSPAADENDAGPAWPFGASQAGHEPCVYRMLVHLPAAEPLEDTGGGGETEDSDETGEQSDEEPDDEAGGTESGEGGASLGGTGGSSSSQPGMVIPPGGRRQPPGGRSGRSGGSRTDGSRPGGESGVRGFGPGGAEGRSGNSDANRGSGPGGGRGR